MRPMSSGGPAKFTMRLLPLRPHSSPGFLFAGPSTSTRWLPPIMARLIAFAWASICACNRARRSCFTGNGVSSASSAAGVPGRGL